MPASLLRSQVCVDRHTLDPFPCLCPPARPPVPPKCAESLTPETWNGCRPTSYTSRCELAVESLGILVNLSYLVGEKGEVIRC